MDENYEKMVRQQMLLLDRLSDEAKRDYYVDLFVVSLVQSLKTLRKDRNLTLAEVAELMGVKKSYLAKVESLDKTPTLETIAKYCYALNLKIEELIE